MIKRENRNWLTTLAIAGVLPLTAAGLAGCSTDPEEATDENVVEESEGNLDETQDDLDVGGPYNGPYDDDFTEDYETYVGEEVTLTANVDTVISPESFTISGVESTTVEPLLVVHDGEVTLEQGESVEVSGTVEEAFDLPTVEEDMELDLDDEDYADYDADNYIEATSVEMTDES
ncbi:hypothetical protein OH146_10230 [Salinibacterium sp. SYSU T00001]|uniref:hypothetical protein n=1 Tax=Homoserinimonas sedimenticola TaxID=2986805 RepID=UPI002235A06B|nr:hypothetical protein [Salinibacterium sedimenticola]MCW4386149.1 hypothetical protein [Salinibacterium sedimenticola]